jgi:hypothetical protein
MPGLKTFFKSMNGLQHAESIDRPVDANLFKVLRQRKG